MKILLVLITLFLFGCNGEKEVQEIDTDGDGYTDSYEASMYNEDNPLVYNKFISDLPLISIRMVSEPVISINYEGSIKKTITSSARSSSTSSKSNTTSFDESYGVKGTVSASLLDFGVSGEASSTYSFGESVTRSYSHTFDRSRAYESSSEVSFKEAKIVCPIYVRNMGATPIIINDMILTAYIEDWYGNIRVIGNLTLDNSDLKELALDSNSPEVILGFKNDTLYPSELESLFADAKSVSVVLSSLAVYNKNYYEQKSLVASKTARINILHSNFNSSKKLDVVVNESTLKSVLNLAKIQHDEDFLYFDNVRANFDYDGYTWAVNHTGTRNNKPFNTTYNIINEIDFSRVIVKNGDQLTFYKDDTHFEDSPLGEYGDDLFYYYDDFAKIEFIGAAGRTNYWSPQYLTHISRKSNRNAGSMFFAELFQDKMPEEIHVKFKSLFLLPEEVMVNDKIIDLDYIDEDTIAIRDISPITTIEIRFIEPVGDGRFQRYVQSYTIKYKDQ